MERNRCASDSSWDSLLGKCISHNPLQQMLPQPSSLPINGCAPQLLQTTTTPTQPWPVISPALWAPALAVVASSALLLLLWFFIYRQQSRTQHNTAKHKDHLTVPQPHGRPYTVVTLEEEEEPSTSYPNLIGQYMSGAQEVHVCEASLGLELGVEPGVPLPATEMGDSALVTTKTVQSVD